MLHLFALGLGLISALRAIALPTAGNTGASSGFAPSTIVSNTLMRFTYVSKGSMPEMPAPQLVLFTGTIATPMADNLVPSGSHLFTRYSKQGPNSATIEWGSAVDNFDDSDELVFTSPKTGTFSNPKSGASGAFRVAGYADFQTLFEPAPDSGPKWTIPDSLKGYVMRIPAVKTAFSTSGEDRQMSFETETDVKAFDFEGKRMFPDDRLTYRFKKTGDRTADYEQVLHAPGMQKIRVRYTLTFLTATSGKLGGDTTGPFELVRASDLAPSEAEPDPLARPRTFSVVKRTVKDAWYPNDIRGAIDVLVETDYRTNGYNAVGLAAGDTGVLFFGGIVSVKRAKHVATGEYSAASASGRTVALMDDQWLKAALVLKHELPSFKQAIDKVYGTRRVVGMDDIGTFEFFKMAVLGDGKTMTMVIDVRAQPPFQPSGFSSMTSTSGHLEFTVEEVGALRGLLNELHLGAADKEPPKPSGKPAARAQPEAPKNSDTRVTDTEVFDPANPSPKAPGILDTPAQVVAVYGNWIGKFNSGGNPNCPEGSIGDLRVAPKDVADAAGKIHDILHYLGVRSPAVFAKEWLRARWPREGGDSEALEREAKKQHDLFKWAWPVDRGGRDWETLQAAGKFLAAPNSVIDGGLDTKNPRYKRLSLDDLQACKNALQSEHFDTSKIPEVWTRLTP